jgi:hypothetical protein
MMQFYCGYAVFAAGAVLRHPSSRVTDCGYRAFTFASCVTV